MVDLPPQDEGIGDLLTRLVEDARSVARAEVALYRAQIFAWLGKARTIAIFAVVGLMLVNSAVIALTVGMVLILLPHVGPMLATLIVVVGALLMAGLCGWLALRHMRTLVSARAAK